MNLSKVLDRCTPIGYIPEDYAHLSQLCKEAHIGYRQMSNTTTVKTPEKVRDPSTGLEVTHHVEKKIENSWLHWFAVYDDAPHPLRRSTPTGKVKLDHTRMQYGANDHQKFCALLAYVISRGERSIQSEHMHGYLDRTNVLDVALGFDQSLLLPDKSRLDIGKKVTELRRLSFRDIQAELAAAGVRGYVLKAKSTTDTESQTAQVAASFSSEEAMAF